MKYIWTILFVIALVAISIINLTLEFSHAEMTRAQLTLAYWHIYIIEVPVILFLYFMTRKELSK